MPIKQAAAQGQPCCGSFTFTRLFAQQITSTIIFRVSLIILGIVSTRFVFGCPSLKSIRNFLIIAWLSLGSIDWDKRARKALCCPRCNHLFYQLPLNIYFFQVFYWKIIGVYEIDVFQHPVLFWVPYPKKIIIFFLAFIRVNILFEFLSRLTLELLGASKIFLGHL